VLHVDVRNAGDVVILDLKGKLVAGVDEEIFREVMKELFAESWKKILLNLSEINAIDSTGVGELVNSLRTARKVGCRLKLLNLNERVRKSLHLGQLLPLFEVYDDEPSALAGFV
jgi:anti-sigma B factor antagonist